jgi:membrane fusion protein, multidrug efflux system
MQNAVQGERAVPAGAGEVASVAKVMRRLRQFLTVALAGVLIMGAAWAIVGRGQTSTQHGAGRPGADAPIPVLAAQAVKADVPVYLDGVGTTRALNMVTVHTQVDGILIKIKFQEGQDVRAGDVLAQIDPRTYQAQLDQQVAKKALDEAQLANARLDLERYSNLVKTNAVTKQQYDTQRAMVAQLEAQVRLDQGAVDYARTQLDYCTITAPIAGRIGIRLVDQGNLVQASDPTGILVITQIQPIAVIFTLPQQQLPQVNRAFTKGPLAAEAVDSATRAVLGHGTLTVVNNQVDQTTGTVQLKAEFPNPELELWPGQFVNVRLLVDTLRDVVTVPTAAVQRGPSGPFVYVVANDGTVATRPVSVTQQDESRAVVAEGIAGSDRVVTSGFAQLSNGRKVSVATRSDPAGGAVSAASKSSSATP